MASNRPGGEPQAPAGRQNHHSSSTPTIRPMAKIPHILPHERVFPVQIGSELFKLSGASLSSDGKPPSPRDGQSPRLTCPSPPAPSYFSQYFHCQIKLAEDKGEDPASAIRTLYIDRDPVTFRDISLHLQGYHVTPRDGEHFVRLFADAQFYSLPRLISQLYEESIFMSIGHREFQIPRDLFQDPGNSPNFFSLGFAIFFSNPTDLFPGLDREGLLRPPSILPPSVPGRSADVFAEILQLLRGYPVHIRDAAHRASLLRDVRYFNFKGLEQRLIPHTTSYNQARARDEIALRLEDILKSGIAVAPEPVARDPLAGWVTYARPFVDDRAAELVLEIGGENARLHLPPPDAAPGTAAAAVRVSFLRDARTRVARLFEVIATKLSLPPTTQPLGLLMARGGAGSQPPTPGNTPLSEDRVRVHLEAETAITLDGRPYALPEAAGGPAADDAGDSPASVSTAGGPPPRKRRRVDAGAIAAAAGDEWVIRTGQWRLRIQGAKNGKSAVECVLVAVKLDAMTSEHARNSAREFLGDS